MKRPAAPKRPVVLQVVPELGAGGSRPMVLDLVEAVARSGGTALVATRGNTRAKEVGARGGRLIAMPAHTKNPYGMMANVLRLVHLIDMAKVDILHVHARAPALSALLAARLTGRRVVTTYRGTDRSGGGLKRLYNAIMVRADAVVACSRFIADHVAKTHRMPPSRIDVVPGGIDMTVFDPEAVAADRIRRLREAWGSDGLAGPDDPLKRRIILLPGLLKAQKGQQVLIEALARLKAGGRHVDNWTAVLIGDAQGGNGYVDALKQRVKRLNLKGRVVFHGPCEDMPAAYLAADVVLSPSVEPEAFGRVAVEAQAMERPVIATDHGGAVETVLQDDAPGGPTGWRVAPRDPKDLSQGLAAALDLDTEAWAAMGARGRSHVENTYALSAMTRDTLALYRRLLQA